MDRLCDCGRKVARPQQIRGETGHHRAGDGDAAHPPLPGREQRDSQHGELWFYQRCQDHHDRDEAPPPSAQRHQENQPDRRQQRHRVGPIDNHPHRNGRCAAYYENHYPFQTTCAPSRPHCGSKDRDRQHEQVTQQRQLRCVQPFTQKPEDHLRHHRGRRVVIVSRLEVRRHEQRIGLPGVGPHSPAQWKLVVTEAVPTDVRAPIDACSHPGWKPERKARRSSSTG